MVYWLLRDKSLEVGESSPAAPPLPNIDINIPMSGSLGIGQKETHKVVVAGRRPRPPQPAQ
jgi:hypothetical protein